MHICGQTNMHQIFDRSPNLNDTIASAIKGYYRQKGSSFDLAQCARVLRISERKVVEIMKSLKIIMILPLDSTK